MSKRRRVEVDWKDSALIGGSWEQADSILGRVRPVRCRTVGFVLVRNKRHIVLAANSGSNGQVASVTIIPASAVRKVRRLK